MEGAYQKVTLKIFILSRKIWQRSNAHAAFSQARRSSAFSSFFEVGEIESFGREAQEKNRLTIFQHEPTFSIGYMLISAHV